MNTARLTFAKNADSDDSRSKVHHEQKFAADTVSKHPERMESVMPADLRS